MSTWVGITVQVLIALISILALGLSVYTVLSRRGLERRLDELTGKYNALADAALRDREREDERRSRADIDAGYTGPGRRERIRLFNRGGAPAKNVRMEVATAQGGSALPSNLSDFPIAELLPGADYSIIVATSMGNSPPLTVKIGWEDPDGSERTKEKIVS